MQRENGKRSAGLVERDFRLFVLFPFLFLKNIVIKTTKEEDPSLDEQVDEILLKIHHKGLRSLTRKERKLLDQTRQRLRRQ